MSDAQEPMNPNHPLRATNHEYKNGAGALPFLAGCWLALGLVPAVFQSSQAAESGEVVAVVYNSALPASKEVALHYASRRQVPANQVIGLRLSKEETVSRTDFRRQLQVPLLKALEHQGLLVLKAEKPGAARSVTEAKIRYLVLCYGVPLRIERDRELKEPGTENFTEEMKANEAAVDSELALLPELEKNLRLAGPLKNPFYSTTNAADLNPRRGLLMVARLDGPTPAIASGLVDKAMEAERDGLWGRAYFDMRGLTNSMYQQGDEWMRSAAEAARKFGLETVLDNRPETFPASFPLSQVAIYNGWYDGDVSGPFARRSVEFMPGAVAYHLHSSSAATLRSDKQHWAGPLVARGAAATLGCVYEPYLAGTPDLAVFVSRFLSPHFSFGEAAYAAQGSLSWQTTVVGDPLYRPFARHPKDVHESLEKRRSKLIEWSHLRVVNLNLAVGTTPPEMAGYLEQEPTTKTSAVLMEKLSDLYVQLNLRAAAIEAGRQALKLEPTPQQRVRLFLTLGERLVAGERPQDALDTYQRFLKECPDYPDQRGVYGKLLALAEKLKLEREVENFRRELKRLTQ
jgi:uncharacterized protein (TIGR03790 family)